MIIINAGQIFTRANALVELNISLASYAKKKELFEIITNGENSEIEFKRDKRIKRVGSSRSGYWVILAP